MVAELSKLRVKDVMHRDVVAVNPDDTLHEAVRPDRRESGFRAAGRQRARRMCRYVIDERPHRTNTRLG